MAGNVPMNRGSFAKFLWPGINATYGRKYAEHGKEYPELFDVHSDTRAYVEDVGISSFGLPQVKTEGAPITYDSEIQGFVTRYTHVTYALGFIITKEMMEDDQYDVIGNRRATALAFVMNQGQEIIGANVYNRAFDSNYVGGDGKELLATDHPNVKGGTWSNELSTAADLSEAALEQAVIDIGKWEDDAGNKIAIMPKSLIVPVDLMFEACRILESPYRVGTANNDINALMAKGKIPGGYIVNHYLTDSDAWFLRTNAPEGMKWFNRRATSFDMDNDFDTENAKFKASFRVSAGWTDPRGLFGSPGA